MADVLEVPAAEQAMFKRHLFDVHDVDRMVEAGILEEGSRIELIEGELIDMHPIGPEHSGTVNKLNYRLVTAFGEGAVIAVQNPVRLDIRSQPQPDFAVLRARADFYGNSHPTADDVLVLVEVAESSVRYDRTRKANLYGRHGVREYWIVDLVARVVAVLRDPGPEGYRDVTEHGPDDTIAPLAAPDILVVLRTLIG